MTLIVFEVSVLSLSRGTMGYYVTRGCGILYSYPLLEKHSLAIQTVEKVYKCRRKMFVKVRLHFIIH